MQVQLKDFKHILTKSIYVIKSLIIICFIPKQFLTVLSPCYHPSSGLIMENSFQEKSYKNNSQLIHPYELHELHPIEHSLIDNWNYNLCVELQQKQGKSDIHHSFSMYFHNQSFNKSISVQFYYLCEQQIQNFNNYMIHQKQAKIECNYKINFLRIASQIQNLMSISSEVRARTYCKANIDMIEIIVRIQLYKNHNLLLQMSSNYFINSYRLSRLKLQNFYFYSLNTRQKDPCKLSFILQKFQQDYRL
ncbi:unnamed protein product [Paramecium primaurelia]|uniref:Uncharacterized protein n=1 Tax=Paramecium primaurelia TaxID=5886 RepID=A0A8S1NYB8_PARPR|nr:unnamed protein product [Paramecium primaurelia]